MNNEVNLLYSKKQLRLSKLSTQVRLLRLIAVGFLFLVCGVSMLIFFLVLASPIPKLREQEKTLSTTLATSHDKIAKQTLVSIRLNDVATIVNKRSHYNTLLQTLLSNLPEGSSIKEFNVLKKKVIISVESDNLASLEIYFSKLKGLVQKKDSFSAVYLNSLDTTYNKDESVDNFAAKLVITLL